MVTEFREIFEKRHLIAEDWKQKGKKVFGYIYSFVPEELVYAAGILPVQLTEGEPATVTTGEFYLPEFFCDFVHSCLGQGMEGKYEYLDGMIVPDACSSLRALGELWQLHIKTRFFYFLGYPCEANEVTRTFYLKELSRLRELIEDFCGTRISDKSLHQAIGVYNENRELLRRLYELRLKDSPPLSGSQIFDVVKAGLVMPKEEHNKMLKVLLAQLARVERKTKDKVRLMVSAFIFEECTRKELNFISLIEKSGAEVVYDDLTEGPRYFGQPVNPKLPPLEAIVERYLGNVPIPYRYSSELQAERHVYQALRYQVKGAIFFLPKYCFSSFFTQNLVEQKFKERGIPILTLESTADMSEGPLKTRSEAFIEMIK